MQIKSLAGSLCKIKIDFIPKKSEKIRNLGNNVYQIDIRKNETIVLMNSGRRTLFLSPVKSQRNKTNWFGLNKNRDGMLEIYKGDQ